MSKKVKEIIIERAIRAVTDYLILGVCIFFLWKNIIASAYASLQPLSFLQVIMILATLRILTTWCK